MAESAPALRLNPDRVIECLPSRADADTPPRYPPAVYRDLVLAFYRANYFHQQGHRSEAMALAAASNPGEGH